MNNVELEDISRNYVKNRLQSPRIVAPQQYFPFLCNWLLSNGSEHEYYNETLQDKNSSKWESSMQNEMNSLKLIRHGS